MRKLAASAETAGALAGFRAISRDIPEPADLDPPAPVTLSVVVPSYRRPADLRRCLEALAAQTLSPSQVVVVVREDDAATRELLESLKLPLAIEVELVLEGGVRAAMTRGLAAARSEVVVFTDDDTAPRVSWLERIAARFSSDEAVGAVGGRDVVYVGPRTLDGTAARVGRVLWFGRVVYYHHFESQLQDVQFLKGANMAFRRGVVAGFDKKLRAPSVQWACDTEASLSVWRRGWRVVYDPEVIVDHYGAPRFDEDRRERPSVRNRANAAHNELYLFLKHLPLWQKSTFVLYSILVGYRNAPGIALLVERLAREHNRKSVAVRFAAATMGRLLALWTYACYLAGSDRESQFVTGRPRISTE